MPDKIQSLLYKLATDNGFSYNEVFFHFWGVPSDQLELDKADAFGVVVAPEGISVVRPASSADRRSDCAGLNMPSYRSYIRLWAEFTSAKHYLFDGNGGMEKVEPQAWGERLLKTPPQACGCPQCSG